MTREAEATRAGLVRLLLVALVFAVGFLVGWAVHADRYRCVPIVVGPVSVERTAP